MRLYGEGIKKRIIISEEIVEKLKRRGKGEGDAFVAIPLVP